MKESNELSNQTDEFSEVARGHRFESFTKRTIETFRYLDKRACSYCKLPIPFCNSKPLTNLQNDDNYCLLWCMLTQKHKIENHGERV